MAGPAVAYLAPSRAPSRRCVWPGLTSARPTPPAQLVLRDHLTTHTQAAVTPSMHRAPYAAGLPRNPSIPRALPACPTSHVFPEERGGECSPRKVTCEGSSLWVRNRMGHLGRGCCCVQRAPGPRVEEPPCLRWWFQVEGHQLCSDTRGTLGPDTQAPREAAPHRSHCRSLENRADLPIWHRCSIRQLNGPHPAPGQVDSVDKAFHYPAVPPCAS